MTHTVFQSRGVLARDPRQTWRRRASTSCVQRPESGSVLEQRGAVSPLRTAAECCADFSA
eukprot:3545564-Rhodomonas_salina.3